MEPAKRQEETGMNSSLIGKIEKAHRYAKEPDRFVFSEVRVSVRGDNDQHDVTLRDGRWHCPCDFFAGWSTCSHTMAVEHLLEGMVPEGSMATAASV
jgi:hypothetical protein